MKFLLKIAAFYFSLMLGGSQIASSQDIPGLIDQLNKSHSADEKIELLTALSGKYLKVNPDSSIIYALKALELANKTGISKYNGDNYAVIGDVFVMKDSLMLAEKYYDTALIHFEEIEDFFEAAGVLTVLGNINIVRDNTSEALQYYLKALKLSEEYNIERRLPYLFLNIGTIHDNANNLPEAQDYFSKALDGFEKVNDSLNIGRVLSSIGNTYIDLRDYDLANEYFNRALNIFLKLNAAADIAIGYYSLSLIEKSRGNYQKAIEYLNISLKNVSEIDYNYAGPRFNILAKNYVGLGENHLLLGNLNNAKKYLKEGLELAESKSLLTDARDAAKNLFLLYEQKGKFDSAIFYHKIYKQKSELLINEENIKKLANIEARHKYNQLLKEEELKRTEELASQQRKNIYYIVSILILILLILILALFLKLGRNKVARIELQRKNLQNELELRNKELTTHVMTQLKKNEYILEISEKLEKTLAAATAENKPIIERVIKELESENTQEVWKEFEIRFQNVHHDFYKKLVKRYPDLSSNELRLCAFIKLNLNTKEISSITHQSVNSIDVARSRLRHKMGLNKEDNLTAYLTGF